MTATRHPAVIGAVAVLHAGLLALLLTSSIRSAPRVEPVAIATRAVPSPPVVDLMVPPAPALATIAADIPMPAIDAEISEDCPLMGAIAAALAADREVGAALAAQPDTTAIMVWDGGWSTDAAAAISPIRRVVVDQVRRSSDVCRSTNMVGPRLFMVPYGTKTVAIAIGSGSWVWRQLLS